MLRRVNKFFALFFCFFLLSPTLLVAGSKNYPQNLSSIYGKITDSNKNRDKLLPGVKAYLFSDTLLIDSVIVKETGDYKFDNLREGTYDIVIRGNEYFPVKILGTKISKENSDKKTVWESTQLSVLTEKYKPEDISYRLVNAYFKPILSEAEIEKRVTELYDYEIETIGGLYRKPSKFLRLDLFDGGKKALSCSILIPEGETATSVANILIMDPYVYRMQAIAGIKAKGDIIEKSGTKKLK